MEHTHVARVSMGSTSRGAGKGGGWDEVEGWGAAGRVGTEQGVYRAESQPTSPPPFAILSSPRLSEFSH